MPSLTELDKWFFRLETDETPSAVAALMTLRLPPGAPDDFVRSLVEDMRATTQVAPPFTYRLKHVGLRRVDAWIEALDPAEIDLDYHFRHSALPSPGGERELGQLVQRLFSQPLDLHKPLWECHVIEGLEDGRFAWFFKVHHAFMDGMGAMRRLERMLDADPAATGVTPIWTLGPSSRARGEDGGGSVLGAAGRILGGAAGTVAAAAAALRETVLPTDRAASPYRCPATVLNGRISQNRRFATQRYELDRISALGEAFGVTVNDVFLALCTGALRRYLDEIGELPDESLVALLPVSIRPEGDTAVGNALTSIFVRLPTEIHDPAARIAAISDSTRTAKANVRRLPKGGAEVYPMISALPQALQLVTRTAGRTRPPYNILLSNGAGPTGSLFMRGAEVEAVYPLTIITHGMALNISTGSFAGWLNVGFTGCRDTLPSLQRLAVYMGEALGELESAARSNRRLTTRRPR